MKECCSHYVKLIIGFNFEYRVEKLKTSMKLGNSKFWVYFNLEDLLTQQIFGSLKAMGILSALAASVAELAGAGAVALIGHLL